MTEPDKKNQEAWYVRLVEEMIRVLSAIKRGCEEPEGPPYDPL